MPAVCRLKRADRQSNLCKYAPALPELCVDASEHALWQRSLFTWRFQFFKEWSCYVGSVHSSKYVASQSLSTFHVQGSKYFGQP